jgi:decaprenylphospho-beta-D-erythro-pentofuranosid-2-ulose 2-reductase
MKRILIIGATSTIASACARLWAAEGCKFFLVARDQAKVMQTAADLSARGASETHLHILDVLQTSQHDAMFKHCFQSLGGVDIALLAHGILSDQELCQRDVAAAMLEFDSNASSFVALLTVLAEQMRSRNPGTIAVISSVAGDRGRASNYVYGCAKAAVSAYCEGLRARLAPHGIHVLTIKPGPVATAMTAAMKLPTVVVATPEAVARDITKAINRRVSTLYTPWFWRPIMAVISALPESILRRLPI